MLQRAPNPLPTPGGRAMARSWVGAGLATIIVTSIASNLVLLAGPIFMLQVYDRILPSRSLPSLLSLSLLVAAVYGFYALVELIRMRIASRLGRAFEDALMPRIVNAVIEGKQARGSDPFADADAVRAFASGPGPTVLLDLPWLPLYLGLIFLMHPLLGQVTLAGILATVGLLVVHEFRARGPATAVADAALRRGATLSEIRHGTEAIRAMGLQPPLTQRLTAIVADLGAATAGASDRAALYSSFTRGTRLMLQSAVLATGAFLVISGESTAGIIIAASILSSRAVAPVEQAVSHWRSFVAARQALRRLLPALAQSERQARQVLLPAPQQRLEVIDLAVATPEGRVVVGGISFELVAGDALGIIGPSGSGKSSLGRALVGVWPARTGEVRFDGQPLAHYDPSILGAATGYLPQDVGLLSGSIADNISRFQAGASAAVQTAAAAAGVQMLVAGLADGYETPVGERGGALSAGQRQRIGLARALYGQPFLIVLDEPNANLDAPGEAALAAAVLGARARGAIVIVIAHRASALTAANKLLLLAEGRQAMFGSKEAVLGHLNGSQAGAGNAGRSHADVN